MYRIIKTHPELVPYENYINQRMKSYKEIKNKILGKDGELTDFANAHGYYGFHKTKDGWIYREWAPAAEEVYLTGDFNNWHWTDCPLKRINSEDWEVFLPGNTIGNGCHVKTIVKSHGALSEHLPLFTKRAVQDPKTYVWTCEVYDGDDFVWTDDNFSPKGSLYIYEAHVGMAVEEEKIGSYVEFADNILPYIKESGYNTIQLMAIAEHPYYGSFGYQVSNFYAPSSKYGYPWELKYLINKAHNLGLRVLLDLVHSHAVKNTVEGINNFDGTETQFFHEGGRGDHPAWGTKCFNYGKPQVLHFLLSNLKYWLTEYHFDGFRFDGVTSMLYYNHGLGVSFDNMDKYFTMGTDMEAVNYLQLANELIKKIKPNAITIAEDMSGMPGTCEKVGNGGLGFDYRLGMGIPDLWIKNIKEVPDEHWDLDKIWLELTFRNAATIAYAESHDQALVGDKTIMFRLADAAMYTDMDNACHTLVIDRAMALHKMIRLLTLTAGGDAYLAFMGNEFGHPEWIDFPREGNGWSHKYCRRQWSLRKNGYLKYGKLGDFDHDMIELSKKHNLFKQKYPYLKKIHNDEKIIAYEKRDLLFIFNFHPDKYYQNYIIPVGLPGDRVVIMSTDDAKYGGYGRVAKITHSGFTPGVEGSAISIDIPPRTAIVLKKV